MRIFFLPFSISLLLWDSHCEFVVSAMIFSAITKFSFGVKKIYLFSTLELQSQRKCHSSKWFAWWNAFCCCECIEILVRMKLLCTFIPIHLSHDIESNTNAQMQKKNYHLTERAMAWAAKNKTLSRITFYV